MPGKSNEIGRPPDGYSTVTPYLIVHRPSDLIGFLVKAFEGEEKSMYKSSDGKILYAEVKVGDSILMIREATASLAATPTNINLYVGDADSVFQRAIKAGASSVSDPEDQPHGERTGVVKDSTGNQWWISTRLEKS